MLAGLGMVFVIVLRLIWSFVGTRHARLTDLALNPAQLFAYFKGMFSAVYTKSGLAGRSELSAFFLKDLLPPGTALAGTITVTPPP